MPTLIRLLIVLLFLGALGYGGLYALSVLVEPGEKTVTMRIPARDLMAKPAPSAPSPDGTFDLGAPAQPAAKAPASEPKPTPAAPGASSDFE